MCQVAQDTTRRQRYNTATVSATVWPLLVIRAGAFLRLLTRRRLFQARAATGPY
jgi:hypothetical protein